MSTQQAAETDLLLQAILGRVRAGLIDQAMAAIRPAIVARVEAMLAEMKPQVEAYRDVVSRDTIIKFSVREPQA